MTAPLTVAVCSYNGESHLAATLQALQAQRIEVPVDLLVVDDGSTDGTARVAESAGIRVVRHGVNRGVGAARRTAVESAVTPFIAFTDDDCLPDQNWLAELWRARDNHPEGGAWGGLTVPRLTDSILNRYTVANSSWAPLPMDLAVSAGPVYRLWRYLKAQTTLPSVAEGPVFSLAGSNMLLDRQAVLSVGGFDAHLRFGGEEEDLLKRLRESGRPLWFTPRARILHAPVGSIAEVAHRSYLYGRGDARMFAAGITKTPAVFPLPLLVPVLAFVLRGRARWWLLAAPALGYPRWAAAALRSGDPELFVYAYIQFLQEAASNAGWVAYTSERIPRHGTDTKGQAPRAVRTYRGS